MDCKAVLSYSFSFKEMATLESLLKLGQEDLDINIGKLKVTDEWILLEKYSDVATKVTKYLLQEYIVREASQDSSEYNAISGKLEFERAQAHMVGEPAGFRDALYSCANHKKFGDFLTDSHWSRDYYEDLLEFIDDNKNTEAYSGLHCSTPVELKRVLNGCITALESGDSLPNKLAKYKNPFRKAINTIVLELDSDLSQDLICGGE